MLASAFDGDSGSVNLDLLTTEDLDALRQASGLMSQSTKAPPSSATTKSKRYLILTYQGEFDKVHYPMALSYCELEDVGELKRTILRLRDELEIVKRTSAAPPPKREVDPHISNMKMENGRLLDELDHCRADNDQNLDVISALRSENHLLRTKVDVLESQLQQVRMSSRGSRAGSLASSPANSLRNTLRATNSRGPSPRSRASSPARSQQPASPYRSSARPARPPLHSAVSRTNLTSPRIASRSPVKPRVSNISPVRPRLPTLESPPVVMSEVDARLQALQNFLKHQKSIAR